MRYPLISHKQSLCTHSSYSLILSSANCVANAVNAATLSHKLMTSFSDTTKLGLMLDIRFHRDKILTNISAFHNPLQH